MTIDGIEILDWMTRNNSLEKLTTIVKTNYKNSESDLKDSVDTDYDPEASFGIILLQHIPTVIAMGLYEDEAIDKAMLLWNEDPNKQLFIFHADHLSLFM